MKFFSGVVIGIVLIGASVMLLRTSDTFAGANTVAANPVGTAFVYQGRLEQNGVPASGMFDFQFALFSASSGSSALQTLSPPSVLVAGGLFSVVLDYGAGPTGLNGEQRFIGVSVKENGSGTWESLGTLQELTPTPYAVFSATAGSIPWTGVSGKPAGLDDGDNDTLSELACSPGQVAKFGAGLWNCAEDADGGSGVDPTQFIRNGTTLQPSANFYIGGDGMVDGILSAAHYNVGIDRVLSAPGTANVFVGRQAGNEATTGSGNTALGQNAGSEVSSGSDNTALGYESGFLTESLTGATAVGAFAQAVNDNQVQLGRIGTDTVRIGTLGSPGAFSLCISGGPSPSNHILSSCSSSARYKTAINPLASGIDLVAKLHPVTFDWKGDGSRDLGLIAEEVEKVEPLLVTYLNGQVEGVKYEQLTVLLINAINELAARNDALEVRLSALESQTTSPPAGIVPNLGETGDDGFKLAKLAAAGCSLLAIGTLGSVAAYSLRNRRASAGRT